MNQMQSTAADDNIFINSLIMGYCFNPGTVSLFGSSILRSTYQIGEGNLFHFYPICHVLTSLVPLWNFLSTMCNCIRQSSI